MGVHHMFENSWYTGEQLHFWNLQVTLWSIRQFTVILSVSTESEKHEKATIIGYLLFWHICSRESQYEQLMRSQTVSLLS